jgi:hypothetical protein
LEINLLELGAVCQLSRNLTQLVVREVQVSDVRAVLPQAVVSGRQLAEQGQCTRLEELSGASSRQLLVSLRGRHTEAELVTSFRVSIAPSILLHPKLRVISFRVRCYCTWGKE